MNAPLVAYRERSFQAQDGVAIYYRDYGDPKAAATPVLFLSGLTRNAKDAHIAASHLARERRVLAMDYRGRGRSTYDPDWRNYEPRLYVSDVLRLLAVTDVQRVVVIGSSLGGLCAMGLGTIAPNALAGVVLIDIGPKIDTAGRDRIAGYVGADLRLPSLEAAADHLSRQYAHAYPDWDRALWLAMADATFVRDDSAGNYRLDYDLRIADALKEQAAEAIPDLWPLFHSLRDIPVLAVRGALSDILDEATFAQMSVDMPKLTQLVVPNCGHVPLPHREPLASAIDDFLHRV
jgi:pimeloyl-ACP methyl ester carboxylesterase